MKPLAFSGVADNAAVDADIGVGSAVDAAAAAAAELALLSPRSKRLREIFESLAAGRGLLTQEALVKWDYVSRSIERGLVSQYQVRALCYPCKRRILSSPRADWRDCSSLTPYIRVPWKATHAGLHIDHAPISRRKTKNKMSIALGGWGQAR